MCKIAIASKNRILSRLAELEVISASAEASVFDSIPKDLQSYDILIVDLDTVPLPSDAESQRLIPISAKGEAHLYHTDTLRYPFLLGELRERISKSSVYQGENTKPKLPPTIYADRERRTIELSGSKISLSDYEFRTLERLCRTPGVAVSRAELLGLFDSSIDGNMADVYICHLRKKLGAVCDGRVIITVRGAGYMTNYKMI